MAILERVQTPIGASGMELVGSESWRSDEHNVDLSTPLLAVRTFERMRRSDAQIRSSFNHLLWGLLAAQWRIDAQKDDPQGEEIAKFVRSVLMPGETYGYSGGTSWIDTLRNTTLALLFGFSVIEKVWGYEPQSAKQVYAALELRMPKTIRHWNLTKTGPSQLESVTQFAMMRDGTFDEITIPADRVVVCTFNREGDNFWGESILRPAHYHWMIKRELMRSDAIQKERLGGLFWVQSKKDESPTPEQISNAKLVLQNFRIHEKQGLYFPYCFDFHAEFPSGEGGKFISSVEYHDQQIERSMFAQFQSLGTGDKGALSVGNVQVDMMLIAYQAVAKWAEDVWSGPQGIVQLVDTNFGPRPYGLYPRVVCENFLQMKPDRLGTVLQPLIQTGAIRIDQPLRHFFREKYSLPPEDPATLEPVPNAQPFGGAPGAIGGAGAQPSDGEASAASKLARIRKAAAAAPNAPQGFFWRDAMPHEIGTPWADMQRYLDEQPNRIWYRDVLPVRDDQIEALASSAAAASEAVLVSGAIAKPFLKELSDALYPGLLDAYKTGRRMVLSEAMRARGIAKAAGTLEDQYPAEPTAKQSTWIRRLAQGLALTMTLGLVKEAVRSGQAAQDQVLDEVARRSAVRDALKALSVPTVQAELGGKVTQAFTTGRVEQGQAMAPEITAVYYSAIMDVGTCDPCAAMDGAELDPEDWASQVPNPNCDWPPNCRCGPVFVWSEQKVAA